jgi:hypothetical protein
MRHAAVDSPNAAQGVLEDRRHERYLGKIDACSVGRNIRGEDNVVLGGRGVTSRVSSNARRRERAPVRGDPYRSYGNAESSAVASPSVIGRGRGSCRATPHRAPSRGFPASNRRSVRRGARQRRPVAVTIRGSLLSPWRSVQWIRRKSSSSVTGIVLAQLWEKPRVQLAAPGIHRAARSQLPPQGRSRLRRTRRNLFTPLRGTGSAAAAARSRGPLGTTPQ